MPLTNMKRDPEVKKTLLAETCCEPGEQDAYPYCLRLYLGQDELKKLNITELPPLGTKMVLMALVDVVGTSENKHLNGDGKESENRDLNLQITDMELTDADTGKSTAEKLYG